MIKKYQKWLFFVLLCGFSLILGQTYASTLGNWTLTSEGLFNAASADFCGGLPNKMNAWKGVYPATDDARGSCSGSGCFSIENNDLNYSITNGSADLGNFWLNLRQDTSCGVDYYYNFYRIASDEWRIYPTIWSPRITISSPISGSTITGFSISIPAQELQDSYSGGDVAGFGARQLKQAGQTFTATESYTASSVKWYGFREGGLVGTCYIDFYDTSAGKPTGATLSHTDFDGDIIEVNNAVWHEVELDTTFSITQGTMYAVVLSCPSSADDSQLLAWRVDNDNYATGTALFTTDAGTNWTIYSAYDTNFEVWGYIGGGGSPDLEGNYYDIDPSIYTGILFNFKDDKLHASTNSYNLTPTATNETGTGSFSIPFSEFGFDTNGHWDLHALAYGTALDIESGMFLTTRGYVDVFSEELVDPAYYLIFNVSGFAEPFVMQDATEWYSENVLDYENPTDLFITFTGYFQPYFEKIGGFGSAIMSYFNLNEAYDRGYGLGEVFPLMSGYIHKIEFFFGGFPIFTFLKYIILTLSGIFVVRTILKFIPFIG